MYIIEQVHKSLELLPYNSRNMSKLPPFPLVSGLIQHNYMQSQHFFISLVSKLFKKNIFTDNNGIYFFNKTLKI